MQTISDGVFYRFGISSLVVKMFKSLLISVLLLGIFFFLVSNGHNQFWIQLDTLVNFQVSGWVFKITLAIALLSIPLQVISALISYLTTQFMVSNTTLSRKSGFFLREEESFPLRYINNISTNQNVMDQVFGVGTCIIEMMSDEKDAPHADKVSLDDLSKEKMLELKDILLARTNIQQVTVAPVVASVQQ